MDSFKDAARTNTALLAAAERRALISLAERTFIRWQAPTP